MSGDVHVRFCEGMGVRLPRATHLLLGFAGPKTEAEAITRQLGEFLHSALKLELSAEKLMSGHIF